MFKVQAVALTGVVAITFCLDAWAQDVFHGCPMEGSSKVNSVQALNHFKDRYTAPTASEIAPAITLTAMLERGDDRNRWSNTQAAEITGYVANVLSGGKESTNCCTSKMKASQCHDHDIHIALVVDSRQTEKNRQGVVEITPCWQAIKGAAGEDWSYKATRKRLLYKWVKVQGWMMFDVEHVPQSENTAPGNPKDWRATAWELHPVTSIEVLPGKPN